MNRNRFNSEADELAYAKRIVTERAIARMKKLVEEEKAISQIQNVRQGESFDSYKYENAFSSETKQKELFNHIFSRLSQFTNDSQIFISIFHEYRPVNHNLYPLFLWNLEAGAWDIFQKTSSRLIDNINFFSSLLDVFLRKPHLITENIGIFIKNDLHKVIRNLGLFIEGIIELIGDTYYMGLGYATTLTTVRELQDIGFIKGGPNVNIPANYSIDTFFKEYSAEKMPGTEARRQVARMDSIVRMVFLSLDALFRKEKEVSPLIDNPYPRPTGRGFGSSKMKNGGNFTSSIYHDNTEIMRRDQ